ncbi:MAG TPA: hypothetical protein VK543_01220 [Puia sp.]|nr:hypothetical protein [Puia sp.]
MLTPSDKELDRLSREAAEQFEPDEHISSWERLEPLLDKGIGNKPSVSPRRFGRGPIGYSVLVIMVTGLSYFFLKQDTHLRPEQKNIANQTASNPSASIKEKSTDRPAGDRDKSVDQIGNAEPNRQTEKNPAKEDKKNPDKSVAKSEAATNMRLPASPVSGKIKTTPDQKSSALHSDKAIGKNVGEEPSAPPANAVVGRGTKRNNKPASNLSRAANNTSGNRNLLADASGITLSEESVAYKPLSKQRDASPKNNADDPVVDDLNFAVMPSRELISDHSLNVDDSSLRHYVPVIDSANGITGPNKNTSKSLHINRSLIIGVLFAPDITSVNSVAPDKLSSNFGLSLGYEFLKGLSINTGIIYTKKNYSANGDDFHAPESTFWGNRKPEYVQGDCSMWEIPLTLRYDFEVTGRTTFFINGGFSSYLMRHEDYTYFGHYYTLGGQMRGYSYPGHFNNHRDYFASVIDLSFGIEQRLSKNLSLQVEPFLRMPVRGVGLGQLQLSSYGLGLSLRYAPVLRKTKH